MQIDQIIERKISEQVSIALDTRLHEIENRIVQNLSKPEFHSWGKYLTPKQAMIYTGFRSVNGFKEMCAIRSIHAIKVNSRVIRYDRSELDKLNIDDEIRKYIDRL